MEDFDIRNILIYFSGYSYFIEIYDIVYYNDSIYNILNIINSKYNINITIEDFKNNYDILFVNFYNIDVKTRLLIVSMIILSHELQHKNCDYKSIVNMIKEKGYTIYVIINSMIIKNRIKYKYGFLNKDNEYIIKQISKSY